MLGAGALGRPRGMEWGGRREEGSGWGTHEYHSLKVSVLQCSAVFMVQLSHPYMTTGKTIAFITWTFAGRVISLLLIC